MFITTSRACTAVASSGVVSPNEPGVEGVLFAGDELEGGGVGMMWCPVIRSMDGGVLLIGSETR